MGDYLALDLASLRNERPIPLVSFAEKMQDREVNACHKSLRLHWKKPAAAREMIREHQHNPQIVSSSTSICPTLESPDPQNLAQMHYHSAWRWKPSTATSETGPGVGRSKVPFQFLVVSETSSWPDRPWRGDAARFARIGRGKSLGRRHILTELKRRLESTRTIQLSTAILRRKTPTATSCAPLQHPRVAKQYQRIAQEMFYMRRSGGPAGSSSSSISWTRCKSWSALWTAT